MMFSRRFLVVACLVWLILPGTPGLRATYAPPLPFVCVTDEWNESFEFDDPSYDAKKAILTWKLKTLNVTPYVEYRAEITDGDGVEGGYVNVTFSPKRAKYKAGETIVATVNLSMIDPETLSTIQIRAKK